MTELTEGIKYVGDGGFIVTEDRLKELLESDILSRFYEDYGLGYFGGYVSMSATMVEKYPGCGLTPYVIADKMVGDLIDKAN